MGGFRRSACPSSRTSPLETECWLDGSRSNAYWQLAAARLLALIAATAGLGSASFAQAPAGLPDGPGRNTLVKVCSGCHPPEVVLGRMDTPKNWARKVDGIIDRGAEATDAERESRQCVSEPEFRFCRRPISSFLAVAF